MATGAQSLQQQLPSIKGRLKTLLNNELKEICRNENLAVSGVKSVLQTRIIEQLDKAASSCDAEHVERLRGMIYNHGQLQATDQVAFSTTVQHSQQAPPGPPLGSGMPNGYGKPPAAAMLSRPSGYSTRLQFKPSPFYEVLETLTNTVELHPMPSNRHTMPIKLLLSDSQCRRLKEDNSLRIMIYCAADSPTNPYMQLDIAFPHQVEIKVNDEELKANLRGLKNKPGSTRPADITDLVRKVSSYNNSVSVTYALTPKKFALVIQLVKKHTVEELTEMIKTGNVISKQRVINEMIAKANDPDIVATSTVMSLKCPLSTLRLETPTRSSICAHNRCFDASSFLQLQEQAPTWTCPLCNRVVSFQALAVDQYVQDILRSTSKSVDQVTVEPNGNWTVGANADDAKTNGTAKSDTQLDGDSDDLVEISGHRISTIKAKDTSTPRSFARTPPYSSREVSRAASTAPRPGTGGSKRAASQIIDLTLSDEDEPPRPVKRQSYPTPGGLNDQRNGYASSDALHSRPPTVAPFRIAQPRSHPSPDPPRNGYWG